LYLVPELVAEIRSAEGHEDRYLGGVDTEERYRFILSTSARISARSASIRSSERMSSRPP
jgi:hypothetical protein